MPSNWASRAVSKLKPQRTGDSSPETGRRRLFWGLAAVGLGLVAQLALTGGQPLLGSLGLLIATVLFAANMRPYLAEAPASHWDRPRAAPAAGDIKPDAAGQQPRPPLPAGTSDLRGRMAYVKHNWRELTIAEILSGSMPSLPRDPESTPMAATPPGASDPAGTALGDAPERPATGEE